MIQGIIFDMDGTLLDTERILMQCWIKSAALYGFSMKEQHALNIRSLQYRFAESYLKSIFGESFNYDAIRQTRKKLFAEELKKNGIPVKQGVLPFLQFCRSKNLPTIVATATAQKNAVQYLERSGILPYFTEIVGGDQITVGKPFPDIYLGCCKGNSSESILLYGVRRCTKWCTICLLCRM